VSVDESFILELLKKIQSGVARLEEGQEDIKSRLTRVEIGIAGLRRDQALDAGDIADQQGRIDRINTRLDRIERRLELSENGGHPPTAGT
jgi:hypothetical protein